MRVVIYSRVSTDAQERDGTSLDTQERACKALAAERGWRVVRCIRDAASGSSLERPGIEELRALLRRGEVDMVVAYAVDRLSRNQNHIGVLFDDFERAAARMEFVTERFEDTAVGRFILAARAFIADVEREKIAERTMRGKAERARSGRIPQGTGAGCFGYTYNRSTGHREVEAFQAAAVRQIFEHYAVTRSFSAVSNELNEAGIAAFGGGRWYPLTIRRVLINEAYIGRTVYRKTKRVRVQSFGNHPRSRVIEQPLEEQIEIADATPPIVDQSLWQRVQDIINDPERINRRAVAQQPYALSGRLKCGVCLSAMVGQTLRPKGRLYRYYRCRHVYDRNTGRQCSGRYVPAESLEQGLWAEIRRVLAAPDVVLNEQRVAATTERDPAEMQQLEAGVASLQKREERLVRLFGYGEVDDTVIRAELSEVRRQHALLAERLDSVKPVEINHFSTIDEAALRSACAMVAERLDGASPEDRERVLEALQVTVTATREEAIVEGVLPIEPSDFLIKEWVLSPLNKHRHDHMHEAIVADRTEDARG